MPEDEVLDPLTLSRRKMLETLGEDLSAQGWDQKQKMWIVEGDPQDEYLTLIGEFTGGTRCVLEEKAMKGTLKDVVTGLVVADEAWAYPESVSEGFKSETALAAYRKLVPPASHPNRREVRHLVYVGRDGEAIGLLIAREGGVKHKSMPRGTQCPTDDPVVDAMRSLLGTNEPWRARREGVTGAFAAACTAVTDLMDRALAEQWDEKRIAWEVLAHCETDEQRRQFMTIMPDEFRDEYLKEHPEIKPEEN